MRNNWQELYKIHKFFWNSNKLHKIKDTMGWMVWRFRHYGVKVPTLWVWKARDSSQNDTVLIFTRLKMIRVLILFKEVETMGQEFRHYGFKVPTLWDHGSDTMGPRFRHYGPRFRHYGQGSDTMGPSSDTIGPRFRHSRTNVPTLWPGSDTLGPRFQHSGTKVPTLCGKVPDTIGLFMVSINHYVKIFFWKNL
jgi:hypothetical protein